MEYVEIHQGHDIETNEKYIILRTPYAEDGYEEDIFKIDEFKKIEEETS